MSTLRADLWCAVFVRRHNDLGNMCVVSRRGDPIAGQVWIEVDHLDGSVTLFQNVRVFDGKSAGLSSPSHVLVRGNKIERISAQPIAVDRRADTRIIEGGGRTLMPGLIDAHWHAMLIRATPAQAFALPRHRDALRDL